MKSVYINEVVTYLPTKVVTNREIVEKSSTWNEEKVFQKLGIKERRIADKDEFTSDLSISAVELLKAKRKLDDIDFILYCTQSPDYLIPSNAFLLHRYFGFGKNVGALDFNLGCSGYVYGLSLAKGLIASGQSKKILLITSETYSKHIGDDDISNQLIFGDGASATLISDAPDGLALRIDNFEFGTDGSGCEQLKSGVGGIKSRIVSSEDSFLKMNGQEVLLFTLREIPALNKRLLEVNNIEKVDHYIFHQANKFVVDQLSKKMALNSSLIRNKMETSGNTVSSTIPIVLEELDARGNLNVDEKIALMGFGVGFSWAGVILTKVTKV